MLIPEGKHKAIPIQQEGQDGSLLNIVFAPSGNKGTLGGTVKFEITAGPAKGEQVYWTGWLSDGALKNTVKGFRAIGFVGDDIDLFNDQDTLTLKEVELDFEHEEYKGKVRSKVQWVNKPRVFMDRAALSAAAADIKSKLAQFVEPDDELPPAPNESDDPGDKLLF